MVYILIPARNEETVIGGVIDSLRDNGWSNIVVVNDASTDNTARIASSHAATVISLPSHSGQGAALEYGFTHLAQTAKPDIVVTFDADGQHDARDVQSLVQPIQDAEYDIVLGSRFLDDRSQYIPMIRNIILRIAVLVTRIWTHMAVTDVHNGMRALHYRAYSRIHFVHSDMAHATELMDIIAKNTWKWCEVPVHITYTPYSIKKGQKNWNAVRIFIVYAMQRIKDAFKDIAI